MGNTQISAPSNSGSNRKSRTIGGVALFLLGLAVGIVGICVALKLIFWIGLAVLLVGICVIIYWGFRVRSELHRREAERMTDKGRY